MEPENKEAFNHRGTSYARLGQQEAALDDYDQAIRLDPEYAEAYNNRGVAYLNVSQFEQAILDYDEAIRLDLEGTLIQ